MSARTAWLVAGFVMGAALAYANLRVRKSSALVERAFAVADSAMAANTTARGLIWRYRASADSAWVAADSASRVADSLRTRAAQATAQARRWRDSLAVATSTQDSLTFALFGLEAEHARADALEAALDTTAATLAASRRLHAQLSSVLDSTVAALQTSRRASDRLTAALRLSEPPCRLLPGVRCPGRRVALAAGALAGVGAVWLVRSAAR